VYTIQQEGGIMGILTISSREARARWRDLLDRIITRDSDIIIERNGKPIAAMIPVDDYQNLLDELEDLRSTRRASELYEAWKQDPSLGRDWEEIKREIEAEGPADDQSPQ
jgi:prevent-host-death family protein